MLLFVTLYVLFVLHAYVRVRDWKEFYAKISVHPTQDPVKHLAVVLLLFTLVAAALAPVVLPNTMLLVYEPAILASAFVILALLSQYRGDENAVAHYVSHSRGAVASIQLVITLIVYPMGYSINEIIQNLI